MWNSEKKKNYFPKKCWGSLHMETVIVRTIVLPWLAIFSPSFLKQHPDFQLWNFPGTLWLASTVAPVPM